MQLLKRPEYFSKFGKIHKIVVNNSTNYAGPQVRYKQNQSCTWSSVILRRQYTNHPWQMWCLIFSAMAPGEAVTSVLEKDTLPSQCLYLSSLYPAQQHALQGSSSNIILLCPLTEIKLALILKTQSQLSYLHVSLKIFI